jgi:cellulose synthase (UDP-forming)
MHEPLPYKAFDAFAETRAPHVTEAPFPTPARSFVMLLYVCVGVWYLFWRLGSFNEEALSFSLLLYAAELFGFVTALLHLMMTWRLTEHEPQPPPQDLTVDVFIPTINEPVDIVRRTVIAAMNMSYPHQTWLLDDGARPEMQRLAATLGCRYLSRRTNVNAKAGNLNNALAHSGADFVAVFDADHAPAKDFLERTLGFFSDPRVAFVQTPQDFFNLDSYQHRKVLSRTIWTEQSLFFRVIQQGKDFWNASFFCGSCGVVRRSALDAIGGFATGTVTEDLHTSLRLHKRGYRSIYHGEPLAFGLAPEHAVPYLRQRVRWGQGAMQVWRQERLLTTRGLSLAQRLCYLASAITYFEGWQKVVFYFAPVVVLLTGVMPVAALDRDFYVHFIPYYLLTFLVFEEVARGYGRTILLAQYNLARYFAFLWATFGLFYRNLKFYVTDKTRGSGAGFGLYMVPQYAVLLLNALAIPLGIILYLAGETLPETGLVANVVWATVNCMLAIMLMRFNASRATNLRTEYRFPIPLIARVKLPGRPSCYATVDDISPAGCRLHGQFPATLRQDSDLRGEILMPQGALPFVATVRGTVVNTAGDAVYVKALCCRFDGRAMSGVRSDLERFLYGSRLQWAINRLREQSHTPLSALPWARARYGKSDQLYWAPVLLDIPTGESASQLGLLSCTNFGVDGRALLTYKPVPVDATILGLSFTRSGQKLVSARIMSEERLESPTGPVFVYGIASLIREQEWITANISAIGQSEAPASLAA